MNNFEHGYGMGFGWLVPLLVIGLLIYWFTNQSQKSDKSALEILDELYASGKIDEKEYLKKRDLLKAD